MTVLVDDHAHPDRPDPLAAKLVVKTAAERAKPVRDGARLLRRQHPKLAADANMNHLFQVSSGRYRLAGCAEHEWHRDRKPGISNSVSKRHDSRVNAGNLVHDDHARPRPRAINPPSLTLIRERFFAKAFQCHVQSPPARPCRSTSP